jgi:two-component system chemotaxis sensor kinase CheA
MGLIKQGSLLSEKETLNLLFHSGLSTAKKVTNISGRGVGMDVVRQKINEIRGDVDISSQPGKGTTIVIKLPLTLSIIDGLLLNVSGEIYVIPLEYVQKIFVVKHDQLTRSFQQTVVLDGEQYPFVNLRNDFQLGENHPSEEQVVLINYENTRVGLAVDHVEGEYQAVLKPIGKLYQDQEYISGATILGDGSVALVLDPHKIVKQFTK